jgi:hypothetical protein
MELQHTDVMIAAVKQRHVAFAQQRTGLSGSYCRPQTSLEND